MSARDWNKDGTLEREPNISIVNSTNNRRALQLDASDDHTSGVILRNTRPLPDEYRIEYKLLTYDFGGKKGGNIDYDGKINGYKAEGPVYPCKTQVRICILCFCAAMLCMSHAVVHSAAFRLAASMG